jgi:hypothetical protein
VKYISILRLAPGTENARKALEVFGKVGVPDGTEATYAATDGKTFITIIDTDAPDMMVTSTYAPFFEQSTVLSVVPLDEAWMTAIQAAQGNWD